MHSQRLAAKNFYRARRMDAIAKEDPPGIYQVKVAHTGDVRVRNPTLVKLVAIQQHTEFELVHSTLSQHTLKWSRTITDPSGNKLPAGSINLYMYPMVQFDDGDHYWDKRNQTTEVYGSQVLPARAVERDRTHVPELYRSTCSCVVSLTVGQPRPAGGSFYATPLTDCVCRPPVIARRSRVAHPKRRRRATAGLLSARPLWRRDASRDPDLGHAAGVGSAGRADWG